jgi:DHA1 family inner membrane transport protein
MSAEPTRFTGPEIAAVLLLGVIGVMIPGLQPQLLGALAHEGRLSVSELGHVATAELLAMGIAAGGASFLLPLARLRAIVALATLSVAALDVVTAYVPSGQIMAIRAAAGLPEGILIWVAIGLIVRTSHPARWSGIYLAVQTLAQFGVATLFGLFVMPTQGSGGGFVWLGIVSLAALAALPCLPRAFSPLVRSGAASAMPPPAGLNALAGVACYLAFVVAIWVYVEPLGLQRGIAPGAVAVVAPLSLAMQVLGAGAATLIVGRIRAMPVLLVVALINLLLLLVMARPPSPSAFVAATAVFGFLWLFAMPFQLPVIIAADPSRRAASLIAGAQLVGSSLGPFLAATMIDDADVGGVLWFGAAAIGVAMLLLAVGVVRGRGPTAI